MLFTETVDGIVIEGSFLCPPCSEICLVSEDPLLLWSQHQVWMKCLQIRTRFLFYHQIDYLHSVLLCELSLACLPKCNELFSFDV